MEKQSSAEKKVRFIKLDEVKRLTSISTSEIYRRIGKDQFPKQITIGAKCVVWIESEILAWMDLMVSGRDEA